MVCLWNEGDPSFFSFVPPCFVKSPEGRKEGVHHFLRSF